MNSVLNTMVEVDLVSGFPQVRETLERMGVGSIKNKTLWQSCHILTRENRSRFYITHFKQMFMMDGKPAIMTPEDYSRLYKIAGLLQKWKLVNIVDNDLALTCDDHVDDDDIYLLIIKNSNRDEWTVEQKYHFGLIPEDEGVILVSEDEGILDEQ